MARNAQNVRKGSYARRVRLERLKHPLVLLNPDGSSEPGHRQVWDGSSWVHYDPVVINTLPVAW